MLKEITIISGVLLFIICCILVASIGCDKPPANVVYPSVTSDPRWTFSNVVKVPVGKGAFMIVAKDKDGGEYMIISHAAGLTVCPMK